MTPFVELKTPKNLDIVSDMCFSPLDENQLLASTWSSEIFIYSCHSIAHAHEEPTLDPVHVFRTADVPVCMLYEARHRVPYVGLLDGSVRELDFENGKLGSSNIGVPVDESEISGGINNLCGIDATSIVASSFNGKVQVIDTRQQKPRLVFSNKRKIFTVDTTDTHLVLGLQKNIIEIYDIKKLDVPVDTREAGLKYQIKDIKSFPNQQGFALATIDGRVSVDYFSTDAGFLEENRFTFKCHRHHDKETGVDLVYPVNTLAFNKRHGTLFTGGSDGHVCLWDFDKRKRMKNFPVFLSAEEEPESVAKLVLNGLDSLLAVATSDDNYIRKRRLSESESSRTPSRIYVKCFSENECRPKK
ncbi:Mitotic checkpoint protein BUB3 [Candida viswanathii]|uniref:Mitotic checkpoint protein BUB3 n=1 Tax=Candida viswanathii TaxID=5486 RepID=A0A367YJG4_9ASCO|nr:Mitotic checkpoint protein BUB3 [Candida viswanathii]